MKTRIALSVVLALVVIACGEVQHSGIGTSPSDPTVAAPGLDDDVVAEQLDAGIDAAD